MALMTTVCKTLPGALALVFLVGSGLGAAGRHPRVADAAEQRRTAAVRMLLKQGADPNAPQADGATALHWAAHWNEVDLAKTLLKAGARVDATNDYGVSPGFLAAANGSVEVLSLLLDAGAAPNAALPSGESLLMTAVRSGRVAAVRRLLSVGANPNGAQASRGQTALMWAVSDGNVEIARTLMDAGASLKIASASGTTPLMFAARDGHIEMARMLVAAGEPIDATDKDGSTALLVATVRGHVDLALALLELGAAPDGAPQAAGFTPLMWAVSSFETIPVAYEGVDVDGEWATYAGIPDREKKLALVKALLARGAQVNRRSQKSLPRLVPQSIGARPHAGSSPYLIAAHSADADMMRLLLANGADPLMRANDGETALMAACDGIVEVSLRLTEAKRLAAVRAALEAGVDVEAQDDKGRRAMHIAARAGYHEIIKLLVEKGAEKNPLTKPVALDQFAGASQAAQSPLGLVEGTIEAVFYERPETAAFLRTLGFESVGRFIPNQPGSAVVAPASAAPGSAAR